MLVANPPMQVPQGCMRPHCKFLSVSAKLSMLRIVETLFFLRCLRVEGDVHVVRFCLTTFSLHLSPPESWGIRIFNVTSTPDADKGSEQWEALTYLGTGRGYQGIRHCRVQRFHRHVEIDFTRFECGHLGEGFRLQVPTPRVWRRQIYFGALVFGTADGIRAHHCLCLILAT